ncbi:MAG TPA: ResB protein required for cytochrome C biosynthesis [Verrucomicrobiales bacterium]|nr:ResB protein required for cytochrome C biosynthesis [Verrucomicrobiales bacterium]
MRLKPYFRLLSSLRLTLVLLVLGLLLVFLGTMAQEPLGLYLSQARFFHSFFVDAASMNAAIRKSLQLVSIYVDPLPAAQVLAAPWVPVFPGGYLIGTVLLANLVAAHLERFKFTRKKTGIVMVHAGLILLLLGQLFTDQLATETSMRLAEGETRNFTESDREGELSIVDTSGAEKDRVIAVPEALLAQKGDIAPPGLPFTIRVREYFPNSFVTNRVGRYTNSLPLATQGFGPEIYAEPAPRVTAMDTVDVPTVSVELVAPDGPLGTWLVSGYIRRPQMVRYQGHEYALNLRPRRHYLPFSLNLIDFRHDKYKGTEIPRNFSSQVRLKNPSKGEDREVLIYMNNPLRYAGLTFYQASFVGEDVTILQVVENPSWITPYVACVLVGLGLVVQFLTHLVGFIQRKTS